MPQEITLASSGSYSEVGNHICLIICHEFFSELLIYVSHIKTQSILYINLQDGDSPW